MNEDPNSNPHKESIAAGPEGLAKALEVLVAHAPFRAPAQYDQESGFTAPGAGSCPDVGEWFRLAAGELAPDKHQALLAHAALCTGCLARLRESQSVVSAEATPEEAEELKRFSSTTAQWQLRMAGELARTSSSHRGRRGFSAFVWLIGGLAAVLVLSVLGASWWRQHNSPEKLLAEAYTQSRSFDLRVPGAEFAPVVPRSHQRGDTGDQETVALLSARAALERKLQQSPNDAHWLQLQARAQVMQERFDQAIDTLDRLLAAGPVTASLLLDDGMAYYLRGTVTGSENDRATALDNLRRADELAPSDAIVLFNEAIVMEDRGQVMNAVETWNRFLKFERDPQWLQEGRQRLASLQEKLNRLKTHQSRMEQHLATPQAMRALAADASTLGNIDEELSTSLLPRLLTAAFPRPGDRSRGSPCEDECAATRSLLSSLAASLERNHQDPWLNELLPSDLSHLDNSYLDATQALAEAIGANARSDYAGAQQWAARSVSSFHTLRMPAGEDRAAVEQVYAEQRSFTFARCEQDALALRSHRDTFRWIHAQATSLAADCDQNAGAASMNNPLYEQALRLAEQSHYSLLELRARNGLAAWAFQSGDSEHAWRLLLEELQSFYAGDFPAFRAGTFLASLLTVEESTPRVHLTMLLAKEEVGLFEIAGRIAYAAGARGHLIRAALRGGALQEARDQQEIEQREIASLPPNTFPPGFRAENELGLADVYLDRGDLPAAARELNAARDNLAGKDNWQQSAHYAAALGALVLAQGHPEKAELILRLAIVTEELRARDSGQASIPSAQQDRNLYATLAAVWLAEHRRGLDVLALWERYRMRILGEALPSCANEQLDCFNTPVEQSLARQVSQGADRLLIGQIVLRDRTLLYRADAHGVVWSENKISTMDVVAAAVELDRVASIPTTSQASIDQAALRMGDLMLAHGQMLEAAPRVVLLESDPLLGNLPWPAVATADGPIGLRFSLEELPSLLVARDTRKTNVEGSTLVVGASIAAGENEPLPEVLHEATMVAAESDHSTLFVAANATKKHVAARVESAPLIHFAGHAARYEGETRLLLAASGEAGDKPYLDENFFRRVPPRNARLVVFSACSTGKREAGWNHGMSDIVDTLESLGVPEVVATRWQIDSAAAVPMMDAFYRGLSNGLSVAQALTAARQSLVRDARYKHPYYWAAYYASGVGTTDLREVLHGN